LARYSAGIFEPGAQHRSSGFIDRAKNPAAHPPPSLGVVRLSFYSVIFKMTRNTRFLFALSRESSL
jgi:hypothetical protein